MAALAACEETGAKPTTTVQGPDSADQVLEGFSHYVTFGGVRRSRVEADTAYFFESTQITDLRHVKVIFYDLKGEEGSTLTAKRGDYRWQDGSMQAKDSVVVVNPDGRTLRTQRLKYDNATNLISTDVPFTFDRGEEHLEGNSFKSDPDFKNVVTDRPRGVAGTGMLLPGQSADSQAPGSAPAHADTLAKTRTKAKPVPVPKPNIDPGAKPRTPTAPKLPGQTP